MANDYIDQWNANGVPYDIHDKGRAQPNGVATLDNNGRIPYSQLPESAVELKGYWNANTNTPTLVDGTGTTGDEYYVDVAGSQNLGSGTQYFNVGDRVLYIDGVWKNINSTAVKSVNGVIPNAQGDVNILNKVYPIGSIYQNKSDATNPSVLFGIGHWTQITDVFLCAIGTTLNNQWAGNFNYTLSENNIPQHNHGGLVGGNYATIVNSDNIANSTDTSTTGITAKHPHMHPMWNRNDLGVEYHFGVEYGLCVYGNASTEYADPEGVTITDYGHRHVITQQPHQHTISNYGSATPTAINTTPPYLAVYTWYRDA